MYTVFKKEATELLAITFSNLNRFSKFFHCRKDDEYFQKTIHHTLSMFLHYLGKVNSSNLLQITIEKNQKACRILQT